MIRLALVARSGSSGLRGLPKAGPPSPLRGRQAKHRPAFPAQAVMFALTVGVPDVDRITDALHPLADRVGVSVRPHAVFPLHIPHCREEGLVWRYPQGWDNKLGVC